MSQLAYIRDTLGFDGTTHIPFTKNYRINCSSCEALAINGTPTHERGCPHDTKECVGCNNHLPASGCQRYCADCA